ncbi:MAG: cob(I)yrinic acid a,c-diamide adenosyltransferase [Deltaproteobacteria bacterium]|nr:cob(I)yrinic acid a,c-diamide adenosyltransferase [Deltaproteobacteria bacterium]
MKIYTKTGDDGTTGLFSGKRVPKTSSYIGAYGTVDELNSFVGFAAVVSKDSEISKELFQIQNDLHVLCSDLATPLDANAKIHRIESARTSRLENAIDLFEKELQPLKQFILAGGSELSARLHLARTVSRRAEREVLLHAEKEKINAEALIYLNRLSDYLFVLARLANHRAQISDVFWDKSL